MRKKAISIALMCVSMLIVWTVRCSAEDAQFVESVQVRDGQEYFHDPRGRFGVLLDDRPFPKLTPPVPSPTPSPTPIPDPTAELEAACKITTGAVLADCLCKPVPEWSDEAKWKATGKWDCKMGVMGAVVTDEAVALECHDRVQNNRNSRMAFDKVRERSDTPCVAKAYADNWELGKTQR
jgi:hypothetical protein